MQNIKLEHSFHVIKIPQLQIFQNQNNIRKFNSRMVKGLLSR